MHRRTFTSATKAQIVLSVLRKEKTAAEVCSQESIVPSLYYKWQDEFLAKASSIFDTPAGESEKDRKIKHYEHVIAKITTQNDFLERVLSVVK